MRITSAIDVAIAMSVPSVVRADEPPPAVVRQIDAFITSVRDGKVEQAYADLFAGTLASKRQAEVEQMVALTSANIRHCGSIRDWQLIKAEQFTPAIYDVVYLIRSDGCPLFFQTIFYDNGTKWSVNHINFTDAYPAAKDW